MEKKAERQKEREKRRTFTSEEDDFFTVVKEGKDIVESLNKGVDVNLVDRNGNIPLLLAVSCGHADTCRSLLMNGADPDFQDRSGLTALHVAINKNQIAIMNMLLHDFFADKEICDNSGKPALQLASKKGNLEAVKILISSGAVINATTPDGYTALHWACFDGHLDVATALYEAGADIEAATKFGNTPLSKAIEKRRVDVIRFLLFKGANVSAINKGSRYPLDMLKYHDRLNVLNEDNYPLHALIAHRSSLWIQIVLFCSKLGDCTRVRSYLSRYPQLTNVKDPVGRLIINELDSVNRQSVMAMLHWHGRFRILENLAMYCSRDTLVLKGVDEEALDEFGNPKHVALKFMLSKDRYRREIDARASNLSAEYVLQVVANFPKYHPEIMHSRISNAAVMHSRTNTNNVVASRRRGSTHSRKRSIVAEISAVHSLSRLTSSVEAAATTSPSVWVPIDYTTTDSPELRAALDFVPLNLTDAVNRVLTKEEAESMFCIAMPLADRDLDVAMKHDVQFAGGQETLAHTKELFTQLAKCLGHLHDAGLIHGDCKPLNIVLSDGRWKLIDLGSAVLIGETPSGLRTSSTAYMPPECFEVDAAGGHIRSVFGDSSSEKGRKMVALPSFDVWSLGCILYQLSNKDSRPLFRGCQRDVLSEQKFHVDDTGKILAEDSNSLWALYDWNDKRKAAKLSRVKDPVARHLLGLMLHWSPHLRPVIEDVLRHPYITGENLSLIDTSHPPVRDTDNSGRALTGRLGSAPEHGDIQLPMDALLSPSQRSPRLHRALLETKAEENSKLREELDQVKQRESELHEEINKLRVELGKYVLAEMMSLSVPVPQTTAVDGVTRPTDRTEV